MADELLIHVHLAAPRPTAPTVNGVFDALVAAVDAWPGAQGAWAELGAGPDAPPLLEGPVAGDVLRIHSAENAGGSTHLRAYSALSCWRTHAGSAEPGTVGVWAEASADDCALRLWSAGPFCADLSADADPGQVALRERIGENLESLTQLVSHLADSFAPEAITVHTGGVSRAPWDAHLLFFRDDDVAARHLSEGCARSRDELAESGADALHPWRDEAERARLADLLLNALERRAPTAASVRAALESGRHDRYDHERGWCVLEHPWFVNAFVERFVLEALGAGS